jgi:hypothetical protein
MFCSNQPQGFRWAAFLLCFALFGLAFAPESAIIARAPGDQTIYSLQSGSPAAISNFVDIEAGCNWSGIGGQVFDQIGSPMTGMLIKVSGTLDGLPIDKFVYTGSSQQFGPGGYDLKLTDRPISSYTLRVQLFDASGARLSLPFSLRTFGTCQQNLLVVNFIPISLEHPVFLPNIMR